jgi:hypothetical protein
MKRSFSLFLIKLSSTPLVIVSAIIFLTFILWFLPDQKEKSEVYAKGVGSVDLSFFSPPDRVYKMAETYGEKGRQEYIRARVTFDVVWPLSYTLFILSLTTFCLTRIHGSDSKLVHLNLFIIATLLLDFMENGLAVLVMGSFPQRLDGIVYLMSTCTAAKWTFMGIASGVWTYGLIALPIVLIKRRFQ